MNVEADNPGFSLESYMPDERTRVFNYNGRKLVALLGNEDFPGERCFKVAPKMLELASRQPLTSALLPGRMGYFPCARGQRVSRPNGDWAFTLLFCVDGAGLLELPQASYRMTRGMIALLRPFEFHAYRADEQQPWSYYWIHFNGAMAQPYYDLLSAGGTRPCLALEPDAVFIQAFEKILNVYREGQSYPVLVQAAAALHQLLGAGYALISGRGAPQISTEARIARTVKAMTENVGTHLSIQELAEDAHMSRAYFSVQFRRSLGEPPRSYLNKLKIRKACEYLGDTDAKVESVAHLVGFEDSFYFCRIFKRIMGETPTEYRHRHSRRPRLEEASA